MMISSETTEILARALAIDPSEVSDKTALGVTETWDSLAHMRLILEIEAALSRPLNAETIVSLTSAIEVEAVIANR